VPLTVPAATQLISTLSLAPLFLYLIHFLFSAVYCIFFLYITVCDFSQEFVACQDDRDPGVLILSPFAGAGGLMQEALQVSPPSQLVGMNSSHYQP
jgi:hypothetical protein